MKYYKPYTKEEVQVERWRWIAYFDDGSELHQYESDPVNSFSGLFHSFAEIKATGKQVVSFKMISENYPRGINLLVPEGAEVIHYYRRQKLGFNTSNPISNTFFVFGWRININGQSVKRLIKIYPEDQIEIMDDDGRENYD